MCLSVGSRRLAVRPDLGPPHLLNLAAKFLPSSGLGCRVLTPSSFVVQVVPHRVE